MIRVRLTVAAMLVVILVQPSAAYAQRRSHIGDVALTVSETGAGTIAIGGTWGLQHCAPDQLTPTIRDTHTIDLAIDFPDGDILCVLQDQWSLTEDFQITDENGESFRPSQLQVDASFYVDNVTTGKRELVAGPFSVYEEPPMLPIVYRMEGEVLKSVSLVPPNFELPPHIVAELNEWGVEIADIGAEFYLRLNAVDDWSFAISLAARDVPFVTHVVYPTTSSRHITKNATNLDSDELHVSYADGYGLFERLDLDVDLVDGTGTWDWFSDCPVCDLLYALPAANGTIHSVERAPILEFDCSFDGRVSFDDLYCSNENGTTTTLLADLRLLPGDLDGDGTVAFPDFSVLAKNFGPHRRTYPQGDIDGDERVGMSDFLILAENFNKSSQSESVPEPTYFEILLFTL